MMVVWCLLLVVCRFLLLLFFFCWFLFVDRCSLFVVRGHCPICNVRCLLSVVCCCALLVGVMLFSVLFVVLCSVLGAFGW